ncbi:MAG: HTH domain-containing protein [Bacteroidales bacterium]|nr:HTH domain-containing protein [Candidatus Colicola equi]
MNKPKPFLITSFELAEKLNVSERTALRYMQRMRKELGLPKRCLLKRSDVYAYFKIPE